MWRKIAVLILLAAACGLAAPQGRYEIRGRVVPAPGKFAHVVLHGSDFPFEADENVSPNGRFRFKGLEAGQYTVIVSVPGRGQVRRSVPISENLTDSAGRIEVIIPFQVSGEALEAAVTVSARELSIPDRAKDEWERAQKRLNRRDVKGAIKHLEKAVEIAPRFVTAWNNLGTIAYQSGRYADAEKYFRTALGHEPGNYTPVVNLGGALLSQGRFQEALEYNELAFELRPTEALSNAQLGLNWYHLGNLDKAIEYLTRARRIDPNHFSHPQIVLAEIYAERGETEKAAEQLHDFLNRHPDSPRAEIARRWLEKMGQ